MRTLGNMVACAALALAAAIQFSVDAYAATTEPSATQSVVDWWKQFWIHTQFWDAFWPAVWGALIGAASAAIFENRRQKVRRIDSEVGQCNKLIFLLGQMLSTLEDFNEDLFAAPSRRLGRNPEWNEIGALVGAPDEGPDFILGEYTFLLEDRNPNSLGPAVLGRIYTAESRFRSILKCVNERSQLWHEFSRASRASKSIRGEDAVSHYAESQSLEARLAELAIWLWQDIPDAVALIKAILPQLRTALTTQYPKRKFLQLWPTENPSAPPL